VDSSTHSVRPHEHIFVGHDVKPSSQLDGRTLSWRQKFVDSVRCLTAEEVATECGHGAKNTSATASRWKDQGKIFAVKI
jgi:hypothetical protein